MGTWIDGLSMQRLFFYFKKLAFVKSGGLAHTNTCIESQIVQEVLYSELYTQKSVCL